MATAAPPRRPRTKAKKVAPPPTVVEDTEDEDVEDDELEELEEDEVQEAAPKAKKSTQPEVGFGVSDLVAYLKKKYPEKAAKLDTRGLRNLIRKMARDDSGRVQREIVAGNRQRYDWGSVKNEEVKAIIRAFLGGELEADKQEKLAKLKESQAARKALAEKAGKVAGKRKKARPAPAVVEADEDDEELDFEEDED